MPTPPAPTDLEYRLLRRPLEIRQQPGPGDSPATLIGYGAVFNELSVDLGGWREIIMPGAFANAITGADVRALWQHNPELVLGRTTNNTLRLAEDDLGLRVEIDIPATTWAADALINLRRGDVDQMSFGFLVPPGGDTWRETDQSYWLRTLWRVEPLYEVSPVTFPAYPATSIQARNYLAALQAQTASPSPTPTGPGHPGQAPTGQAATRQRTLDLIKPF